MRNNATFDSMFTQRLLIDIQLQLYFFIFEISCSFIPFYTLIMRMFCSQSTISLFRIHTKRNNKLANI